MYGREELKSPVVDEYYGECEWESHPNKYYFKSEADSVMDAMEARIKELEEANKRTQKHREEVESSESNIRQEMFKMKAHIKELETENSRLHQANFDGLAHFNTLKEDYARLKAMKWISVDDIKPQWGKEVKVKFKDGSEDEVRFSYDYKWVSKGMGTCESSEVTHWMPLPATEKSSATEKENG